MATTPAGTPSLRDLYERHSINQLTVPQNEVSPEAHKTSHIRFAPLDKGRFPRALTREDRLITGVIAASQQRLAQSAQWNNAASELLFAHFISAAGQYRNTVIKNEASVQSLLHALLLAACAWLGEAGFSKPDYIFDHETPPVKGDALVYIDSIQGAKLHIENKTPPVFNYHSEKIEEWADYISDDGVCGTLLEKKANLTGNDYGGAAILTKMICAMQTYNEAPLDVQWGILFSGMAYFLVKVIRTTEGPYILLSKRAEISENDPSLFQVIIACLVLGRDDVPETLPEIKSWHPTFQPPNPDPNDQDGGDGDHSQYRGPVVRPGASGSSPHTRSRGPVGGALALSLATRLSVHFDIPNILPHPRHFLDRQIPPIVTDSEMLQLDAFELTAVKRLAVGRFGEAFLADAEEDLLVVKVAHPYATSTVLNEAEIYSVIMQNRSPGLKVPTFYGLFNDEILMLIILSYHGHALKSWKELSADNFLSLQNTVKSLHDIGICHNDLYPRNVLLDDKGQVWLIDFTNSFNFASRKRHTGCEDLRLLEVAAQEMSTGEQDITLE